VSKSRRKRIRWRVGTQLSIVHGFMWVFEY
jgi:hypothetical protein